MVITDTNVAAAEEYHLPKGAKGLPFHDKPELELVRSSSFRFEVERGSCFEFLVSNIRA